MIKFSHSLQFNTVPDWANDYITYINLKKSLYAIEKYNVENAIEGAAPLRPSDIEQGLGSSSQSEKPSGFRRFIGKKEIKKEAAAAAPQEAALHTESDIFPPESAAFEQELAKELAKITSFYIRKERELLMELEAVDRQWQLEELKSAHQQDHKDMERCQSINIFDERQLKKETAQLNNMVGRERDGLQDRDGSGSDDQDNSLQLQSHTVATTANGSIVGDGSNHEDQGNSTNAPRTAIAFSDTDGNEYHHPTSHGRMSSVGDLTGIVWRRECLIESDDDDSKDKAKAKKTLGGSGKVHPMDGPSVSVSSPLDSPQQYQYRPEQQNQQYLQQPSSRPETRHQSLDDLKEPKVEATLKRSQSQANHQRRLSLNPRRSFSAVRDIVTGGGTITRKNPNLRPTAYAPLTAEALLRRRLIDTYMLLSELKSYVALNYLGFQKIVKKHDKLARTNTLSKYMSTVVDQSPPFKVESRQHLDAQILRLQAIYARTCTNGSMSQAAKELRAHLREYIVWERNTIWRDMVVEERKAEGVRAVDPKEQEPWMVCGHAIRFMNAADARRIVLGIIGCVIFALLMCISIFETREQNRCFAILITVAYFWATEVFPLFVTALLVPLLAILCQVMRDPTTGETLTTKAATKFVFASMFSPTIMLLLGGFTIASALSKFGIAKAIASSVLSKAGTDPKWVLLANMFVATIAS
ncbi:low-affinity phosphate transporter, partial [Mortierella sp. NVP41]